MQSSSTCLLKRIEKHELEAQKFGFCWESFQQLIGQIQSECIEIQEAWQQNNLVHLEEEIGDLIHAAISLAVFCKLDPHATLLKNIEKFQKRYKAVVQMAQNDGHDNLLNHSHEALMDYWDRAKIQTKKNS